MKLRPLGLRSILAFLFFAAVCCAIVLMWPAHTSDTNQDIPDNSASDSVKIICSEVERLLSEAPIEEATADIPGEKYLQAKALADIALSLCRDHGLPSTAPDSLLNELYPRLQACRIAILARLQVVEGIRSAEIPLTERLVQIDSTLASMPSCADL